jgi:hypothetical protein
MPSLSLRGHGFALLAAVVVAAAVVLGAFLVNGVQRGEVAAPGPSASRAISVPSFMVPFEYAMPPISSLRVLSGPDERYLFGIVDEPDTVSPPPSGELGDPYLRGITTDDGVEYPRGISFAVVADAWTHGQGGRTEVRESPAELLDDLHTIGGVAFGEPATTSLDGRSAIAVTVSQDAMQGAHDVHVGGHLSGLSVDYVVLSLPTRLTLVDVNGVTLLVAVWALSDDELAAWLPVATPIVDSIRFLDLPERSNT